MFLLLPLGLAAGLPPNYGTGNVMFYQVNEGILNGVPGEDINAKAAWEQNAYGQGAVIGVIGDGCRTTHHDFAGRVRTTRNFDDGSEAVLTPQSSLGTNILAVAGAGADAYGTVGIAQQAELNYYVSSGLRDAVTHAGASDSVTVLPLRFLEQSDELTAALAQGSSVFVAPAGDKAAQGQDASSNWFARDPDVVVVGSSTLRGAAADYSNAGSNVVVNAPTSGHQYQLGRLSEWPKLRLAGAYDDDEVDVVVADTSIAAGEVAGVIAMMKGVNPGLTRRDVNLILALTATVNDRSNGEWIRNAAGNWWHPQLGYGRVDAGLAVQAAREWSPLSERTKVTTPAQQVNAGEEEQVLQFSVGACGDIEFVTLKFDPTRKNMRGVKVTVRSASGTQIEVIRPTNSNNLISEIVIRGFLGEQSEGTWTVEIQNFLPTPMTFSEVTLTVYGTSSQLPLYSRRMASSSEIVDYDQPSVVQISVPSSWTCGTTLPVTLTGSSPLRSSGPYGVYLTNTQSGKRIPVGEIEWRRSGSRSELSLPCFSLSGSQTYTLAVQFEPFNWTVTGSFSTSSAPAPGINTPTLDSTGVTISWVSAGHVAPSRRVYIQVTDKQTSTVLYSNYTYNTGSHRATFSSSTSGNLKIIVDQGSTLIWDDGFVPTLKPTATPAPTPTRRPTTATSTPPSHRPTPTSAPTQRPTATHPVTAAPSEEPAKSGGGLSTSGKVAIGLTVVLIITAIAAGVAIFFLRRMNHGWKSSSALTEALAV